MGQRRHPVSVVPRMPENPVTASAGSGYAELPSAAFYARLFDAAPRPLRGGAALSPGRVDLILYDTDAYAARFGSARPGGFAGIGGGGGRYGGVPPRLGDGAPAGPLGPVATVEGNDPLFLKDGHDPRDAGAGAARGRDRVPARLRHRKRCVQAVLLRPGLAAR